MTAATDRSPSGHDHAHHHHHHHHKGEAASERRDDALVVDAIGDRLADRQAISYGINYKGIIAALARSLPFVVVVVMMMRMIMPGGAAVCRGSHRALYPWRTPRRNSCSHSGGELRDQLDLDAGSERDLRYAEGASRVCAALAEHFLEEL